MDAAGADAIDGALDAAFDVRSRPTLALNCLPMGVTFGSRCMTVATTSVREDMAAALVEAFGAEFAQILLVADPLFLKRLVDHARHIGLDWSRHRVQAVVGEEVFGERFRGYMADRLGLDLADPHGTWLMSSMGVGELGLHLFYETRALVSLRRLAATTPALAQDLMGAAGDVHGTPLCFTYDPGRIYVEVDAPGADGFGPLLVSMLDPDLPIPLLRYQTGDVARVLDAGDVRAVLRRHGASLVGDLPDDVVLVRGRAREALPDGSHVAIYKDAIYADAAIADELTGAVRVTLDGTGMTMHVQRVPGGRGHAGMIDGLRQALPTSARTTAIEVWPYERFPFGMTLDYERKFVSYVP
jgi:phenylacetate-CoA ligase